MGTSIYETLTKLADNTAVELFKGNIDQVLKLADEPKRRVQRGILLNYKGTGQLPQNVTAVAGDIAAVTVLRMNPDFIGVIQ